jgi:tetratricopeptide (TPR) repeat protein
MSQLRAILFALCVAATSSGAASSLVACAKQAQPGGEEVIDETLLAYLSQARALHHEADIAEDQSDVKGAIAALERLLAKAPPRVAPEVDEVMADTRARLGDLRSRLGEFDAGQRDVEEGLKKVPGVTYFRGHLLEVRGLIEERRAKALEAAKDSAGAAKSREAAMKAYEEAILIQEEVIKRGTKDGGKP